MRGSEGRTRRSEVGFTLIELLIVVVILGVVAAIVVASVGGVTNKGALAVCQEQVSTVDAAEQASLADGGGYVASIAALQAAGYLRGSGGALVYVASYDTAANHVVLTAAAPPGCTPQ